MRIFTMILTIATSLFADNTQAEDRRILEFYTGLGTSIPLSTFHLFAEDVPGWWTLPGGSSYPFWYSSVFHATVGVRLNTRTNPPVSVNIQLDWSKFAFDEERTALEHDHLWTELFVLEPDASIFSVTGNIEVFAPSTIVIPYMKAGLGVQIFAADAGYIVRDGVTYSLSVNNPETFCVNLGGGIDFPVVKWLTVFADGTFQNGFYGHPRSILSFVFGMTINL